MAQTQEVRGVATRVYFDFGMRAALESYGTWGIYLRHCGRTRFDLYPGHTFSRYFQAKVRAALALR